MIGLCTSPAYKPITYFHRDPSGTIDTILVLAPAGKLVMSSTPSANHIQSGGGIWQKLYISSWTALAAINRTCCIFGMLKYPCPYRRHYSKLANAVLVSCVFLFPLQLTLSSLREIICDYSPWFSMSQSLTSVTAVIV